MGPTPSHSFKPKGNYWVTSAPSCTFARPGVASVPESVADRRAYEDARPSLSSSVYPNAMKKLLQECWHKDPESRPSFEEIITQLELIQENLGSSRKISNPS